MRTQRTLLILVSLLMLLTLAACGEDDGPVEPTPEPWTPPTSTAELLNGFTTALVEMNIVELSRLLHDDFEMVLLSETCEAWEWPVGTRLDRTQFVDLHENMFSGQAGTDSRGSSVHPVASIIVDLFEAQDIWKDIEADDPWFADVAGGFAPYRVNLQFFNAERSHKYEVQQRVHLYAVPVTIAGVDGFQLIGLGPLPLGKSATDEASWCTVCALYL